MEEEDVVGRAYIDSLPYASNKSSSSSSNRPSEERLLLERDCLSSLRTELSGRREESEDAMDRTADLVGL